MIDSTDLAEQTIGDVAQQADPGSDDGAVRAAVAQPSHRLRRVAGIDRIVVPRGAAATGLRGCRVDARPRHVRVAVVLAALRREDGEDCDASRRTSGRRRRTGSGGRPLPVRRRLGVVGRSGGRHQTAREHGRHGDSDGE